MTAIINKQSESLHARIPQEILQDLDSIASSLGRSRNWVFNEAIKQYVDVQKWQIELINQRLTQSEKPNARFISHSEIIKNQEKRLKSKLKI